MPIPTDRSGQDYSKFDALSTDALKELLYQDSLLPENEESDMGAILYIMEVIANREALNPTEAFTPVEAAWKSFNEHYRSDSCDGTSLYEDQEEAEPGSNGMSHPTAVHPARKQRLRGILRVTGAAAILAVVLLAGSMTAYAMGYDIWGTLGRWTENIFGLINLKEDSIYANGYDPRDVLREYGVTESIVPTWLPDGYQYVGIEVVDTPARKVFDITYSNDDNEIVMTIALLSDAPMRTFEKDEQDVTVYSVNGIKHYMMENTENFSVVWAVDHFECSIVGNISMDDAKQIIDSIYRS